MKHGADERGLYPGDHAYRAFAERHGDTIESHKAFAAGWNARRLFDIEQQDEIAAVAARLEDMLRRIKEIRDEQWSKTFIGWGGKPVTITSPFREDEINDYDEWDMKRGERIDAILAEFEQE